MKMRTEMKKLSFQGIGISFQKFSAKNHWLAIAHAVHIQSIYDLFFSLRNDYIILF